MCCYVVAHDMYVPKPDDLVLEGGEMYINLDERFDANRIVIEF